MLELSLPASERIYTGDSAVCRWCSRERLLDRSVRRAGRNALPCIVYEVQRSRSHTVPGYLGRILET